MRASVVVFPGTNRERDVADVLAAVSGKATQMVWHGDAALPPSDVIVLPGGFSYGDYLRCGAIARFAPVAPAIDMNARRYEPPPSSVVKRTERVPLTARVSSTATVPCEASTAHGPPGACPAG